MKHKIRLSKEKKKKKKRLSGFLSLKDLGVDMQGLRKSSVDPTGAKTYSARAENDGILLEEAKNKRT